MNHIWKIYDLKRTIADGVVTEITYACESELSGSITRKIGNLSITGSTSDPSFVEYTDLTEGVVLSWVTGSINVSLTETENSSSIAQQITAQAAITESNGKPWNN